jgi:4-aminobutyrate aminotransferase
VTKHDILLAHKQHLFPAVYHFFKEPLILDHAQDQYVWDIDGNQYLDFLGGIVTVSVGHANQEVNRRVHEQLDKLVHISPLFAHEPQAALAARLAEITPGKSGNGLGALTKSFFSNSGTEANEMAILTARCYTGNTDIIALRHSYHGRSALTMGITGHAPWKLGLSQPGIVHAHNAYCYRCPFGLEYPSCEVRCAQDMEELIRTSTSGNVAGFIAEPIQGVGGYIVPPKEYFPIIEKIVRNHGGVFISDEVQTAWGRTGGKWFGIEHWGVVPDILTSAKGLGNGAPIGLTMAKPEVADGMKGLTLSTFGGNPISTTAGKAVIDYIDEHNLRVNVAEVGAYLRGKLDELAEKHTIIGEVRGMGLIQGMELVRDRRTKEPAAAETVEMLDAMRQEGVLCGKGGLYGNVLRVTPPMNISKADVDLFAERLDRAFAKLQVAV